MLESVIKEGTGYPNAVIGRPAAGKTGTTSDFRDAWFVGYTPDLVTAVWIGNDDYKRMNESFGGNIPARIWARYMKAALAKTPKHDFAFPRDEVRKLVLCGTGKQEVFLIGTEPAKTCGDSRFAKKKIAKGDTTLPDPVATVDPELKGSAIVTAPPVNAAKPDAVPTDSIGDGTNFETLSTQTPKPKRTP
jgi:penicillin-binding protein 1A